ncbi:2,4-dienoyl-CoA reductase-like NADH-dependent reductase (Old Yellow Enzyme family) [Brassicibacter mesophilus]
MIVISSSINESININNYKIKNRIVMPPLVCFNWANEDGFEAYSRAEHYGKRAKGGTGLIIVEATAISKEGRIVNTELGL